MPGASGRESVNAHVVLETPMRFAHGTRCAFARRARIRSASHALNAIVGAGTQAGALLETARLPTPADSAWSARRTGVLKCLKWFGLDRYRALRLASERALGIEIRSEAPAATRWGLWTPR